MYVVSTQDNLYDDSMMTVARHLPHLFPNTNIVTYLNFSHMLVSCFPHSFPIGHFEHDCRPSRHPQIFPRFIPMLPGNTVGSHSITQECFAFQSYTRIS